VFQAIAKLRAHEQRGEVTGRCVRQKCLDRRRGGDDEKSASSGFMRWLKRRTKRRTERAYENPVFVEDLVRYVA